MAKKQSESPDRSRKNPVAADDLKELRDRLQWALRQIEPMIATLDTKPPKSIEAEGKKMSDRGWVGIKTFIGNCSKSLAP